MKCVNKALSVIFLIPIVSCEQVNVEISSPKEAKTEAAVNAGSDIVTNSPVRIEGSVTGLSAYSVRWSADAADVNIADPSNLGTIVSATTDGSYTLTLTVDSNGSSSDETTSTSRVQDSLLFTWDTTAPLPPVLNRASGSEFSGSVQVAVINEKAADFLEYRYVTDAQALSDCNSGIASEGEIVIAKDQSFTLKIAACDKAGNMSQVTESAFVHTGTSIAQTYIVTPSGANVVVSPSTAQVVVAGDSIAFNVAADAGYVVSNTVGGSCTAGSWNGNQYTTGPIAADCAVSFSANLETIQVTASGQVNSYAGAPSMALTITDASSGTAVVGQTKSFTVTLPTPWHELNNTVNGTCPQGSWAGNVYTTGPLTQNCTVQFAAGTGPLVTFNEIKTLLGTKLSQTSVNTSTTGPTTNPNACINCHKAAESTLNKPSAGFAVTSAIKTTVDACSTDDSCRIALIDYAKVIDNVKRDFKLVGSTTNGSTIVTLSTTTGLAVGNTVTGTVIPTSTIVTAINAATNQITLSQAATATGRGQLTFTPTLFGSTTNTSTTVTLSSTTTTTTLSVGNTVSGTGIPPSATIAAINAATNQITLSQAATATNTDVKLTFGGVLPFLQEAPTYCADSANCTSTTYKRVEPGMPQRSMLCLKSQASVNGSTLLAPTMLSSAETGGVTLGSGTTPKAVSMPQGGPNYFEPADQVKICRWILQGALP